MTENVELNIVALSKSTSSEGNFVLVLEDSLGKRRLPIIIGPSEAQYIGIVLENLKTKRPLTHDLLAATIKALSAEISHVLIKEKIEDVFQADVIIQTVNNKTIKIDARVSDAIALAIRAECPIYILKSVLDQIGQLNEIYVSSTNKTSYLDYSINELENLLQKVIAKEDYESAVRIREAIEKSKKK
ncbi:MAG TPA: bifunctional nuclease family protein [Saprospiraceae bacterium]|nr:bifunctional nuclease family protein [Saprospiraceae bacterium]